MIKISRYSVGANSIGFTEVEEDDAGDWVYFRDIESRYCEKCKEIRPCSTCTVVKLEQRQVTAEAAHAAAPVERPGMLGPQKAAHLHMLLRLEEVAVAREYLDFEDRRFEKIRKVVTATISALLDEVGEP